LFSFLSCSLIGRPKVHILFEFQNKKSLNLNLVVQ